MSRKYIPDHMKHALSLEVALRVASSILDRRVHLHELAVIHDVTPNREKEKLYVEARRINSNRVRRLSSLVTYLDQLAKANSHEAYVNHD